MTFFNLIRPKSYYCDKHQENIFKLENCSLSAVSVVGNIPNLPDSSKQFLVKASLNY